jgi:lipopolysaccharide transport system permease protein
MTSQKISNLQDDWDLILRPRRSWWDLRLGALWRYRDLIWLYVWRDFVSIYRQTILGPWWYLIQPLLTTAVFTFIFSGIAHLSTDGLPSFLFYLAGNTIWTYFSMCFTNTSNTFGSNSIIFGKVYFPRLCIPVAVMISSLISFGIRLFLLVGFMIYFMATGTSIHPNLSILLLPILLLIMGGLGMGSGIIVSSLTIKYRDLQQLVNFGVQLLMYATPVIYPLSTVKGISRLVVLANPITPVVEAFRLAFLGIGDVSPIYLVYSFVFMMIIFVGGVLFFNHVEANFMDTI